MSSSDSDEENVIRYGTPLEPYEEDEVPTKRKYQQQSDQFAVDSYGRRRFHGAFTGGFSAGFGNSVGTPEGWTPSTFKSSRTEKAHVSSQRPEDFMDEEDRSEFGIAPRRMQTQSEFSGQKRQLQQRFHDGPIPGAPVLEQLVRAVHETAAVRMLRAMGWREGQGAGVRVTREEKRRARRQHKVYGCYMPPEMRQNTETDSEEDSTDSEFDYNTLFAPDDYEPYVLRRKDDTFGLGYSGLSRHSVLGKLVGEYGSDATTSRSHLVMKEKGKKVSIRGQAFGVGALEADDDDIYATEDMSHYDFAIGGAAVEKKNQTKKPEKGTNVLEGFVKASKPLAPAPSHPPPALPRDYTPAAAGARRSRFEPAPLTHRDQGLGRHELSAEARGALLGEEPLPKTNIQTNEQTNNREDVDPIAKLIGRNVNFVSTNADDAQNEGRTEKPLSELPSNEKVTTKSFKPFASNPSKQARYERYLLDKDSFVLERDSDTDRLKEWERNRELAEFEQAAKLYKPLTGVIADRFTHASEPDEGALNPLCAVAKSSTNYGLTTPEQEEAATRGLYGAVTRRETQWRPEPLVCKRFNVPDPAGARPESKTNEKPKVSYSIFSYLESSVHDKESFTKEQSKFSGSKSLNRDAVSKMQKSNNENKYKIEVSNQNSDPTPSTSETYTGFRKRLTVAELFLKECEKDLQNKDEGVEKVTETINKFDKMDLYKSIFLSDSENEEDKEAEMKKKQKEKEEVKSGNVEANDFNDTPKNVERNLSPPRGIFANIDFDELNSWKRKALNKTEEKDGTSATDRDKTVKSNEEKRDEDISEVSIYGPKIPDNLQKRLQLPASEKERDDFKPVFRGKSERDKNVQEIDSSSSSDSWVEAKEVKSKTHKKKKKHKSKHKKSKHKKKCK